MLASILLGLRGSRQRTPRGSQTRERRCGNRRRSAPG